MSNTDARGHKTLGLLLMRAYYKGDKESLQVLRSHPSNKIVIVPHVTIEFEIPIKQAARVYIVYPREQITTEVVLSEAQKDQLRKIYAVSGEDWQVKKWGNKIYMTRRGWLTTPEYAPSPIVPLVGEGGY